MQIVPVQPVASQTLSITLNNQTCSISIYQKSTGLYLDLFVGTETIVTGSLCINNTKLVQYAYLGFLGDLAFIDTQGSLDPVYTGLGGRFILVYYLPTDLAA